jgi:trehalose 6-phosphate synthase/phosphatase
LDYDGTLREFEARPEMAVPTPEVHRLLAALNEREDLLVHIISGRDAHFLSTHFGQYGRIILIAEHEKRVAGRFQVWRPNPADALSWGGAASSGSGVCRRPSDQQDWRSSCRFELAKAAAAVSGSHVEEKAFSLVWHHRGAADQEAAEAAASSLADRLLRLRRAWRLRELRVTQGHKTVEVSVRSVTKGEIMRRICSTRRSLGEPFEAVLVAGDDVSDESMFEHADDDFLTIKVGQEDTRAKYFVNTPAQLRTFLWSLTS